MGRFDTMLVGRKTFAVASGGGPSHGMRTYLFSRTLTLPKKSKATLVSEDAAGVVAKLRAEPDTGKLIWLMGGGELFRSLLDAGQVDAIELAIVPVLLGTGIRFLAPGGSRSNLTCTGSRQMPSGMVLVSYSC
jgi:dihydrofolate reductase